MKCEMPLLWWVHECFGLQSGEAIVLPQATGTGRQVFILRLRAPATCRSDEVSMEIAYWPLLRFLLRALPSVVFSYFKTRSA